MPVDACVHDGGEPAHVREVVVVALDVVARALAESDHHPRLDRRVDDPGQLFASLPGPRHDKER